ncbi:hypothetical protein ABIF38_004614 [Bradyrhizobium japonicum]|jgi:hypothetical protein|uniref:Peptidase M48 domain-containing protein n=1 Tax=Bradyrhizobium elkanii TaxID=29448 RepID=A0ABV4F6J7_BRAEL|nr:hypothetical protein [Bradyrhizobium elkanii]MBP2433538.1 hypothetical protein [Bradyrhizobium elkanii]MCP1733074.1 hypothetical protein [Bradyrhizobium elkanii]MCP1750656.1 hypothetical protein [Bradyrhizobium elkanii]MCP1976430.1 hypothetical protein [Bradyrhizobium elkanii]MCS3568412.1 hypothetical protein [Bradyrhizobium elkanii]
MLFANMTGEPVGKGSARTCRDTLLCDILADFGRAFPDLLFELDEGSATVNAQAFIRGNDRVVRIYGGLAHHAAMNADGLVFALLHEVGHHLSKGGRLAANSELGCECAADRWILAKGAARLRKQTGRTLSIERAVSSIEQLTALAACGGRARKRGPSVCWADHWPRRKHVLVRPEAAPAIPRCYLSEFLRLNQIAQRETTNGCSTSRRQRSRC